MIPNAERRGLEATISNTRHTLIMFVDGNPTPGGHMWLYNGNGIDSLSVIPDTFQLILPRAISTSLTGNYTLQVNNSVGVATGTTYLLITGKNWQVCGSENFGQMFREKQIFLGFTIGIAVAGFSPTHVHTGCYATNLKFALFKFKCYFYFIHTFCCSDPDSLIPVHLRTLDMLQYCT